VELKCPYLDECEELVDEPKAEHICHSESWYTCNKLPAKYSKLERKKPREWNFGK